MDLYKLKLLSGPLYVIVALSGKPVGQSHSLSEALQKAEDLGAAVVDRETGKRIEPEAIAA